LYEQVEDVRQQVGRDSDSLVLHAHHHLIPLALGGEPNPAHALGELGRVREQVADDLREPGWVSVQPQGFRREANYAFLALSVEDRLGRFDGMGDHRRQVNGL
jgi:hypothetical protein